MTMGTVASVVGIAAGVNSITGGGVTKALGMGGSGGGGAPNQQAQQAVDPFSPHRAGLGNEYAKYLSQGNTVDPTQMAGYTQFESGVLKPSLEAVSRKMAQMGLHASGNEAIELQKTAGQGYYGFMTDYMNRLATASGASQSPASGGQAGIEAGNKFQGDFLGGLGGVVQGVRGLYGTGVASNSSGYTGAGGAGAPAVLGDSSGYMGGGQYVPNSWDVSGGGDASPYVDYGWFN